MSKTLNAKRWFAVFAIGLGYGAIYLLPYMKSVFYDQMMAAMGFTNEQLGQLVSWYALTCTISYVPGGYIADRVKPRLLISGCLILNGILAFILLTCYTNFVACSIIWIGCALCGGFAFWPAMYKAIRLLGTRDEQGKVNSFFEAATGVSGFLCNLLMVYVASKVDAGAGGFKAAVIVMGIGMVVTGLLVFFLLDEKVRFNEDAAEDENQKIRFKDFLKVIVMPRVWIPAILLFGGIVCYAGISYTTPYCTVFLGMSVAMASVFGTIKNNGIRLISPVGGYMSDKVFHSVSKWQVLVFLISAGSLIGLVVLPKFAWLHIILILIFCACCFAQRSTTYAMLTEYKVSYTVTGTAIAFMTLIGYLPDMFVHSMFGRWLDLYGEAGYNRIFIFIAATGLVCALVALIGVRMSKKINSAPETPAEA